MRRLQPADVISAIATILRLAVGERNMWRGDERGGGRSRGEDGKMRTVGGLY